MLKVEVKKDKEGQMDRYEGKKENAKSTPVPSTKPPKPRWSFT